MTTLAQPERFWAQVEFTPKPNGCWLWTGTRHNLGYGRYASKYAHRLAYEFCVCPVPEGLELDHLCRRRRCVNPDHLEPVTHRENQRRGNSPAGKHARATHCPQGHPYDAENTRIHRGKRYCRMCQKAHAQRRNERLAAERLARYEAGLREFFAERDAHKGDTPK